MADRIWLEYFINLTDEALVRELQATRFRRAVAGLPAFLYSEPGHPIMAPDDAAAEWDAPIQLGDALAPKVGPPNTTSDWFTHAYSNFDRSKALFTVEGGGFWGWLGIGNKDYVWRGTFQYVGVAEGESPVPGVTLMPMPQRRWLDGMELNDQGENVGNVALQGGTHTGRAASRSLQGYGLHIDGPSNANYREHTPILSGRAATHNLWERFYVRVHRTGLAEAKLWKTYSGPNNGLELDLLPSGQLSVVTVSATAVRVLLGTFGQLVIHAWTKVDVIYGYQAGAVEGSFKLFLNGVLVADLSGAALGASAQGLRVDANASFSTLGPTLADTSISLDLDDWIGADWPDPLLSNKDWNAGSHVAYIGPAGFAADHEAGNWTVGNWRGLRIRAGTPIAASAAPMTSAVSGSKLAVLTDAAFEVDLQPGGRGIAAMLVALLSSRPTAPANSGTLGYKLPRTAVAWDIAASYRVGDRVTFMGSDYDALVATLPGDSPVTMPASWRLADYQAAIAEATSKTWTGVYYLPAGLIEPFTPVGGLTLKHVRGANVNLTTVDQLCAVVEIIGIFGPEDVVALTAAQLGTPAAQAASGGSGSVETVTAVKDGLVARGAPLSGACGAFEITKRVAWALKASGCGLLSKPTGSNCEGYSTDIVAFKDGAGNTILYDVLIDGGGANTPAWNLKTPLVGTDRWRAPIDPGDAAVPAAWDAGTTYAAGDEVTYNTRTYGAIVASMGQLPTDTTYWSDEGIPLSDGTVGPLVVGPHVGVHNAPYPRSAWARGMAPYSPVIVKTGTYVGTGTYIELAFDAPIHFLWIRPLTAASGPVVWWSAMTLSHTAGSQGSGSPFIEVLMDPSFAGAAGPNQAEQRCIVRITGSAVECNALAANYAYLAIGDPGMRFFLSDTLQVTSGPLDYVNPLAHEGWTPEALFLQAEVYGTTTTNRLGYKGIGHAAAAITKALGSAETASGLSFGLGTLTLKTGLFTASDSQVNYLALRRNDGSGDPGIVRVQQFATYIGDGAASRSIALAPASGRRPMFALIVPHTAVNPVYRDPSHTTVTSTTWPNTANPTTGITAGDVDSISVGIALNATGVVYDVFAIPGCSGAAGNGGWSTACQTDPVAPWQPPGGEGTPWPPVPPDPEGEPVPWPGDGGGGGGGGGGGTGGDFEGQCVDASMLVINQALSRIGVSKQVLDIVTEQSAEAATARLHYVDDVSEVLRAHPWPFATRYALLGWVAGTEDLPVNGDWTYAYRAPDDMMFARRIVKPGQRRGTWDTDPIDFRVGSDDTGSLIYTDHAIDDSVMDLDLSVELEYTIRVSCAASQGDPLFKSALVWRHAHSLAPILSKDEKKVGFTWAMYQQLLGTAEVAAQQEQQHPPDADADWLTGRE